MRNLSIGLRTDMVTQVIWQARTALRNEGLAGCRINHMIKVLASLRRATHKAGEDCAPVDDAIMFFIDRYPAYDADQDSAVVEQFLGEPARKLYAEFVYPFLPE